MALGPASEVERVYRASFPTLWRALVVFSGDTELASDAAAEAFAQALRGSESIHSMERWIWRSAFRIARGMLKERSRTTPGLPERPYQLPEVPFDLARALRSLSPNQRAVIVLFYYRDYPIRRIASVIDSTPGAVKVHLHRARKRLRAALEEEHG